MIGKNTKLILVTLLVFGSLTAQAGPYGIEIPQEVKDFENKILGDLKKQKENNLFEAYMSAAQEAIRLSQNDIAIYLLDKAMSHNLKKDLDTLPIYSKMMALTVFPGKIDLAKKIFTDYKKQFDKKKRPKNVLAEKLMYRVLLSNDAHDKVLNKEEAKTLLSAEQVKAAIFRHDIKIYFDKKMFGKIYDLYKGDKIKRARIDEKIVHDLSGYLSKKNKGNFLCKEMYDQYPEARESSYSMIICGMLVSAKKGKKPKNIGKLKTAIKKYPHKKHLIAAAEQLLK